MSCIVGISQIRPEGIVLYHFLIVIGGVSNMDARPALAHHGVMTAYIDYAVGHATSDVSALLAGYISNVTPAMMQAFNEKIFIVPPIQ